MNVACSCSPFLDNVLVKRKVNGPLSMRFHGAQGLQGGEGAELQRARRVQKGKRRLMLEVS